MCASAFVVRLFVFVILLFLSVVYLFSFLSYLYSDLHSFFHVNSAKGNNRCAFAQWGVLLPGDIPSSHRLWDIWKVDIGTIRGDVWSVSNQLGKFSMETIISGQWWRSHQSLACKGLCILKLCYVLERWIRTQRQILLGNSSWIGSKIHHNAELSTQLTENIHYIAVHPRSPKVHEQKGRPSAIVRTNYLHVDVQWHHMGNYRQWKGMYC